MSMRREGPRTGFARRSQLFGFGNRRNVEYRLDHKEVVPMANPSTRRLILVPAVITLLVTLLRLVGELQQWSPRLFSREAGGGGALVGISWLVPVFGAWFGWVLGRSGERPASLGKALGLTVLAIAIMPAAGLAARALGLSELSLSTLLVYAVVSVVGLLLAMWQWPTLGRVLLAYALAARIPVALVMLFAILGDWGTHYDVMPQGAPDMPSPIVKWLIIGLLPQLTIWLWVTVAIGGLFGILAAAIGGRRQTATV
jgi:hypothetical protein